MAHPNARLTPATRLELVLEVEAGWSQAEVARRFRVSRATVSKWWRRYRRRAQPVAGTAALLRVPTPAAPQPRSSSASAPCAAARGSGRTASPGRSGSPAPPLTPCSGASASTASSLHRVSRRTAATSTPPPAMLHIDVKKLHPRGRWTPRSWALRRDPAHPRPRLPARRRRRPQPLRLRAVLPDERGASGAPPSSSRRSAPSAAAAARARPHGQRGGLHRPGDFRGVAAAAGVELRHTRPYRPQTNGKAERFIQPANEWAYARPYRSNAERLHARAGSTATSGGIGGAVPASRL